LFSPAPALLERARIAGTSHDSDDPVRFASDGKSVAKVSAAVASGTFRTAVDRADPSSRTSNAVSTSRNPRDWRARRQARRLRLVVKRSRQTGLYGLLDYASRRTVADSLTIDQLENALALAVGSISYPTGRPL
jgi:hypothetical protein